VDEEDGDEWMEVKRWEMKEAPRPEEITIYGYPEGVFSPTDGHVAVYVKSQGNEDQQGEKGKESIYIIGGVGYPNSVHRERDLCVQVGFGGFQY